MDAASQVAIVKKWSTEHPCKTLQSVFLEQYPEAKVENDGILTICPSHVSSTHRNEYGSCRLRSMPCADCRRDFWTQEVE